MKHCPNQNPEDMSRRSFIRNAAAASASLFLPFSTEPLKDDDALDEALEIFSKTGPEYGGLSNHGPMAAEALTALGRSDAAVSWADRYKRRLQDRPKSTKPISKEDWREALGDSNRHADWVHFFNRELKENSWRSALDLWADRLAPGFVAAATHGVIRAGHAARSLSKRDKEARRGELAEGLAYWASRYVQLPEPKSTASSRLLPSQAIKRVDILPMERRAPRGPTLNALRRLEDFPPFAGVVNLIDSTGDASAFISDLTETFAAVYLANAQRGASVIMFIHTVTGPSAMRLLLPALSPNTARNLLRYGWQTAAALYSALAAAPFADSFKRSDLKAEDLIARAVDSGDEHAIKFTEACLREYKINPKPIYLAAARHAVEYLG